MTELRLQILNELPRREVPLGERCEYFIGRVVGEALACGFNYKSMIVRGESGRKEFSDGEVSIKVVLHGAMWQDGSQVVAVELEVRVLKTIAWELFSVPGDDRKLCSDVMGH